MIRLFAVGLMMSTWVYGAPAATAAQDLEHLFADPLALASRMTAPGGSLWETPVRWVPATRGPALLPLYVSLIGLQVYDGYSTIRRLENGALEANTFMTRLAAEPAALWAVKGGVTFVSIYMAERLWRRNRRVQAVAVMVATND
jgi:hypothetical protein